MIKINKKLKNILLTIIFTMTLIGCGGGGYISSEGDTETAIVMCNTTNPVWTTLSSGDIVSTTANSQLMFDHDSNNNKQVCVVSGSATVTKG